MVSETDLATPPKSGENSNGVQSVAFDSALAYVASLHCREVAQLRHQLAQLKESSLEQPHAVTAPTFREVTGSTMTEETDVDKKPLDKSLLSALVARAPVQQLAPDHKQLDLVALIDDPSMEGLALHIATDIASTGFVSPMPHPRPVEQLANAGNKEEITLHLNAWTSESAKRNTVDDGISNGSREHAARHVNTGSSVASSHIAPRIEAVVVGREDQATRGSASGIGPCASSPSAAYTDITSKGSQHSRGSLEVVPQLFTSETDEAQRALAFSSVKPQAHQPRQAPRNSNLSSLSEASKRSSNQSTALVDCQTHGTDANLGLKEVIAQLHELGVEVEEQKKKIEENSVIPQARFFLPRQATVEHLGTAGASAFDRVVESQAFDLFCGLAIVLNSVLIGYNVNMVASTGSASAEQKYLGHGFSLFFIIELIMRMLNQKSRYFTSETRNWNIFDLILVLLSMADFAMDEFLKLKGTSISSLKTVKMLRIMRVFRVFRFFHKLAVLVLMILDSMMSLMWALLMLTIIIYVFAILFTQGTSAYIQAASANPTDVPDIHAFEVQRWFGTVPKAIYTLFQAMLGGVSWGVVTDSLLVTGFLSPALFFFYVSFTMLVVLNIITGVFVENAMETARSQREFLIQKEIEMRDNHIRELRELFERMDEDGSGSVTLEEILNCFEDKRVKGYFRALGLDPHDVENLFKLIDTDGSGEVDVEEFMAGCLRLKGQARSIDLHMMLCEIKNLEQEMMDYFSKIMQVLCSDKLQKHITSDKMQKNITASLPVSVGGSMMPMASYSLGGNMMPMAYVPSLQEDLNRKLKKGRKSKRMSHLGAVGDVAPVAPLTAKKLNATPGQEQGMLATVSNVSMNSSPGRGVNGVAEDTVKTSAHQSDSSPRRVSFEEAPRKRSQFQL